MQQAFLMRALKIYACQAGLLVFAFTVIAFLGILAHQDAVTNLLGLYIERPLAAVLSGLGLVYKPALLDILPMYVLFMLVSPLLLLHGLHRGWGGILAGSVLLWLAAQFDLGRLLFDLFHEALRLRVSYAEMGAFEQFGWQFLWVLGLWMGSTIGSGSAASIRFPTWLVRTAIGYAALCFVWRHALGQTPFPGEPGLNLMFDKWHVGPLRLINFFALLILAMHFGPWLKTHLPRLRVLETLGRASLPVFCAHLVVALTALTVFGKASDARPWSVDVAIVAGGMLVLYTVAMLSEFLDKRAAVLRARLKASHAPALRT
jgi:hypothetical protein